MIDLPNSATFAEVLADRRLIAAVAVAATAGLVRGFSGFGGALIYMPLVAAIYEPRIAAVTLLLTDFFSSTPFALFELRRCVWREVLPISIAMALTVPLGTWMLTVLDPIILRWAIAFLVLGLVAVMMSGWRYKGPSTLPITTGIGMFAGISGGATQIAGPPVILYWLSVSKNAATLRANLMVFFVFCGATLVAAYGMQGLFDKRSVALALVLGVPYVLGVALGSRFFRGTSDRVYRIVAYAIMMLAAVMSLPVLDGLFR